MHTKRIIPCLDVKDGRVVKGINFVELRDAGDPVSVEKLTAKQVPMSLFFWILLLHLMPGRLLWIWSEKLLSEFLSRLQLAVEFELSMT